MISPSGSRPFSTSQMALDFKSQRMTEMASILKEHQEKRAREFKMEKKRHEFNCFFALTGTPAPRQDPGEWQRYWTSQRIEEWSKSSEDACRKDLSSDSGISLSNEFEGVENDVRGEEQCKNQTARFPPVVSKPYNRPVLCTYQPRRSVSATATRRATQSEVVRLNLVEKSDWCIASSHSLTDGHSKLRCDAGKLSSHSRRIVSERLASCRESISKWS